MSDTTLLPVVAHTMQDEWDAPIFWTGLALPGSTPLVRLSDAIAAITAERARAAAPAGEVPGLRRYLADVMADGATSEQSVARVALHLLGAALAEAAPVGVSLGAPPSGSGSTLQPPSAASAAIPSAGPSVKC